MKKLNLRPDELAVETFDPAVAETKRPGTVEGNQNTPQPCCTASCGGTCGAQLDSLMMREARTVTNCPDCCI